MSAQTLKPTHDPTDHRGEMSADKPNRVEASLATGALLVEHCDIPANMTLGEWRAARAAERRAARNRQPGLRRTIRRVLRRS